MRVGVIVSCLSLCAFAANGSPAGQRTAAFRVHLQTVPRPEGRYAAQVLTAVLDQSPLFQIVRDASEAEIVLEPTARIPNASELQAPGTPPVPPQPCYVLIRQTSLLLLPGSVSAHGATCHDAARKAVRGLTVQLLESAIAGDESI